MKFPPIYKLNDDKYFDMNKLEHVSGIEETSNEYYFRYQVNGFVYNSDGSTVEGEIEKERQKLIKEWHKFIGYKE